MEEKQITDIQHQVTTLLNDKRLKQAIDTLAGGIDELQDWELRTRFTEMQTAYTYMLDYMRQGMPDPDRERLHAELIGRCYIINDQIAVARLTEHSTKVYCQMRRKYKNLAALGGIYDRLKENAANFAVTEQAPCSAPFSSKATAAVCAGDSICERDISSNPHSAVATLTS